MKAKMLLACENTCPQYIEGVYKCCNNYFKKYFFWIKNILK
jgi:hypothetical protein